MSDTDGYLLNHSMIRVKDPQKSLHFYCELFGMSLMEKKDFAEAKFSLYFLAFQYEEVKDKKRFEREGILELTHNWGTEKDDSSYNNGNTEPHRGFGHVCFSVDNIQAVCDNLEAAGVKFQKKLADGRQKDIAFALDPDNYWVELIQAKNKFPEGGMGLKETHLGNYRFNHTMLRVKDQKASLQFYQETLGMTLLKQKDFEAAKFTLYFLGYLHGKPAPNPSDESTSIADREGVLELTHNWGTESDSDFKGYHNGNSDPRGFGHICVAVGDLEGACARLDQKGVRWQKRLTDGRMKTVAFVLDPDNYWVEVISKNRSE